MTRPLPVTPRELRQVALFASLNATQLRMLCGLMQRHTFSTDQVLLTAGEPSQRVYVLQSGTVKVCIARNTARTSRAATTAESSASQPEPGGGEDEGGADGDEASQSGQPEQGRREGRTVVLNLCGTGAILGEMSALDGQGCSAGVIALEPCKTLWMEAESFRDCTEEMLNLSRALLNLTRQRFRAATRQLYAHSSYDVEGRLATQLLLFAEQYGEETAEGLLIPLRLYQRDLADMVVFSRVSVNTTLAFFKAQGCLSLVPQNRILIHDRDKLAAFCP